MKLNKFLDQSITGSLWCTYVVAIERLDSELKKQLGVSYVEALILSALHFEPAGTAGPTMLSNTLHQPRARISQILSRMEELGYLRRSIRPSDSRSFTLALEEKGKRTALKCISIIHKFETNMEKHLSKEACVSLPKSLKNVRSSLRAT